jgi:glycerol-3-phosphate responsive antiterminator
VQTTHVVTTNEEVKKNSSKIQQAKKKGIPIVKEAFVHDSIANSKLQNTAAYLLWDSNKRKKRIRTIRVFVSSTLET